MTCEFRKHGALDPESDQGQEVLKSKYMAQCSEDIARCFREHPDGMQGKNPPESVSIATRVFNARADLKEKQRKKEKQAEMKEQVSLLAAMVAAGREEARGFQNRGFQDVPFQNRVGTGRGHGKGKPMNQGGINMGGGMNPQGGNQIICHRCRLFGYSRRNCPLKF